MSEKGPISEPNGRRELSRQIVENVEGFELADLAGAFLLPFNGLGEQARSGTFVPADLRVVKLVGEGLLEPLRRERVSEYDARWWWVAQGDNLGWLSEIHSLLWTAGFGPTTSETPSYRAPCVSPADFNGARQIVTATTVNHNCGLFDQTTLAVDRRGNVFSFPKSSFAYSRANLPQPYVSWLSDITAVESFVKWKARHFSVLFELWSATFNNQAYRWQTKVCLKPNTSILDFMQALRTQGDPLCG